MARRTDPHRKGAIIPAEYEHVLSYNTATTEDGWPVPSLGVNCELDGRTYERDRDGKVTRVINGRHGADGRCCVVGLRQVARVKFASHGTTGKCTACGTRFVYGEIWRHIPTGEHIHVGHICGAKYGLLADRSAFELEAGRRRAAIAAQIQREQNAEDRAEFLAEHPGLEEALNLEHPILRDMSARFKTYRSLTEKQIKLAFKLAKELTTSPVCDRCKGEHKTKDCPNRGTVESNGGRQAVAGMVASLKTVETDWGDTVKMLVVRDDGAKLWGTVPTIKIKGENGHVKYERVEIGDRVTFMAAVEPSRDDPHFGFFKRQTKAQLTKGEQK